MNNNRNRNTNSGYPYRSSYGSSRARQQKRTPATSGFDLSQFPWQPFVAVAFGVIGMVIFSVALTMFTGHGNKAGASGQPNQMAPYAAVPDETSSSPEETAAAVQTDVYVPKADFTGTWQKTDVYESEKATLTITDQDELSFHFTMKIWNGKKTASVSGKANFTGSDSAAYTQGLASISFQRGTQYLSVYHTGDTAELGIAQSFEPDGKYTTDTPNYYTKKETSSYDYNVYQSDAVVKALSATLTKDDYDLYKEMMSQGLQSPIDYERTLDKNGKQVNVDEELKCVKYYAHLNSIGADMIFICSDSGQIYVLLYDSEEMRYYTNDKNYTSKMPNAFQVVANAKHMMPVYNKK